MNTDVALANRVAHEAIRSRKITEEALARARHEAQRMRAAAMQLATMLEALKHLDARSRLA